MGACIFHCLRYEEALCKGESRRTRKHKNWDGVGENQRQYTGIHTHTHTHTQREREREKGKRTYGKAAVVTTSQEIVADRFGFGNECAVDITAVP